MEMQKDVATALETLEALYFFTQGMKGESAEHLEKIHAIYSYLLPSGSRCFLLPRAAQTG
jgi:hypothetical protein